MLLSATSKGKVPTRNLHILHTSSCTQTGRSREFCDNVIKTLTFKNRVFIMDTTPIIFCPIWSIWPPGYTFVIPLGDHGGGSESAVAAVCFVLRSQSLNIWFLQQGNEFGCYANAHTYKLLIFCWLHNFTDCIVEKKLFNQTLSCFTQMSFP